MAGQCAVTKSVTKLASGMSWRRTIADWTLPPNVENLIRLGLSNARKTSSGELSRNLRFSNLHQGQRCFVIATGSSLKRQNLKLLAGEICIGVSNLFVHPCYKIFKPQYHCVPPWHPPITEAAMITWFTEMASATGDASLFVSLSDKARVAKATGSANDNIYYLYHNDVAYNRSPGIDLTAPIPSPRSVTISALYLAVYLGCRDIYLLGFDHDWLAHVGESLHCYEESQHALNRNGYDEWGAYEMEPQFRNLLELWKQYRALKKMASARGTTIYNATDGGWLDVFQRVNYEKLF